MEPSDRNEKHPTPMSGGTVQYATTTCVRRPSLCISKASDTRSARDGNIRMSCCSPCTSAVSCPSGTNRGAANCRSANYATKRQQMRILIHNYTCAMKIGQANRAQPNPINHTTHHRLHNRQTTTLHFRPWRHPPYMFLQHDGAIHDYLPSTRRQCVSSAGSAAQTAK